MSLYRSLPLPLSLTLSLLLSLALHLSLNFSFSISVSPSLSLSRAGAAHREHVAPLGERCPVPLLHTPPRRKLTRYSCRKLTQYSLRIRMSGRDQDPGVSTDALLHTAPRRKLKRRTLTYGSVVSAAPQYWRWPPSRSASTWLTGVL